MTWTIPGRLAATTVLLALATAGCGLLDVSDPTAIERQELEDAAGANLLRVVALKRLYTAMGEATQASGTLADEFFVETPEGDLGLPSDFALLDRRESEAFEARPNSVTTYMFWQMTRKAATLAMPGLRTYVGPARTGEMFAARGFAEVSLAEHFCPGLPLHDVTGYAPVYGDPLSTDEIFERALADFDSAVTYAADSARILNWARVGRARALLGLGRFSEAAAAAAAVPADYVLNAEFNFNESGQLNPLGDLTTNGPVRGASDGEGGTGLDFLGAADPRVEARPIGTAEDGTTIYGPAKYPDFNAPIVMASGLEARLIEAEAALHDGGDWLGMLNALRADRPDLALGPLADPGTPEARLDLLFRERAFWLYATGHRLGDLRRLIHLYGRSVDTLFPTGAYRFGGTYGTATAIPFRAVLETPHNPAVTGCTSR